jgi:hypothetical protein
MEQEDRKIMTKLEWGVVFSVLASAASILFSAGVVWTTVQVHEREISALKASRDETTDRLARIETKLDILLEGGRR